jgi:hypothetical protein
VQQGLNFDDLVEEIRLVQVAPGWSDINGRISHNFDPGLEGIPRGSQIGDTVTEVAAKCEVNG